MFIVGLTGGLATGKSTVLSIFRENGIAVIDADEVARKVLDPGSKAWKEVKKIFGEQVLCPDGKVNRAKLGEMIFDDINKRRKLNAITHPKIQRAMMQMAVKYFFSGHSEDHQQLERLCKRNDFSVAIAKKRISCQMPLEDKVAKSDFVIDNAGDLNSTRHQTLCIIRMLKRSKFTWYFTALVYIGLISLVLGAINITYKLLGTTN
ncbi:dephospho-CoA kinase domain-containing protein isoform X2 [Manduca sexta]|uniref:dephospho-CoA kinase domain-containing protein isoform X2 n=1 Tax=Manduca sexta TaxID=7130 RepID=UPI00188F54F9|nr:dephospho-CoA kinase domain-containing protein isoform X2 [Manduca sexta]